VLNDKGVLLKKMGNFNEAVEVLLLAVKYDPLFKDALNNLGIKISSISDVTPVPHNGCRAPKRRRI
jgi:ribosomal protein S11